MGALPEGADGVVQRGVALVEARELVVHLLDVVPHAGDLLLPRLHLDTHTHTAAKRA